MWIPAHKGHFGNTRADDLSKLGANTTDPRREFPVGKPLALIKSEIISHAYGCWAGEWQASSIATYTKAFYFSPNKNKARFVYKLARLELGRFIRLITGHNNLNYFQTRIGLAGDRSCRLCREADETFLHLLHQCPRLRRARDDLFHGIYPTNDMTWSVRDLLNFSYLPTVDLAFIGTWAHGDPADLDDLNSLHSDSDSAEDMSVDS